MKKLVLTHANCVDGCCSRAILEQHYGSDACYVAVDHSDYKQEFKENYDAFFEKVKDFKDTEIIMSDICLPAEWIEFFLNHNNKVVILDHHDSAIACVETFERRMANGEDLNLVIHFSKDTSKSAALLTWEYVHPHEATPIVVEYVSEGDTWHFVHEETRPFYTGLLHEREPKDYEPEYWMQLLTDTTLVDAITQIGRPLFKAYMNEVHAYAHYAAPITLLGKQGLVCWAPSSHRSEVGNELAQQCGGFGLVLDLKDNGLLSCSLRSVKPYVCNDLAKAFGGGGHKQASAFVMKDQPSLQALLDSEGNCVDLQQLLELTECALSSEFID